MMAPQTPALTLAPPEGVIKAPERFFTANGVTYAADQLLVQFRRGLPDKVIDTILTRHGVTILTRNRDINWITVAVPSNKDVTTLVKELKALPEVEQSFLSGIGQAGSVPTDEYYTTPVGQYAPRITGMEAAWDRTRGNGNWSIAVLDSGIKSNHEDLVNKINGVLGIPFDDNGHGTFVAGIAAAETNFALSGPGTGMAGTDPGARIITYRCHVQRC